MMYLYLFVSFVCILIDVDVDDSQYESRDESASPGNGDECVRNMGSTLLWCGNLKICGKLAMSGIIG